MKKYRYIHSHHSGVLLVFRKTEQTKLTCLAESKWEMIPQKN